MRFWPSVAPRAEMTPGYSLSILVPISALFCYGALAIMMARQDPESRVHRFFRVYLLVMMGWSGASLMLRLNPGQALIWNRVALVVGGVLMPLAWFMFVVSFLGRNPWNRRILPGALLAILLLVATALGYMTKSVATDAQGRVHMQFGPVLPLYFLYWVTYVFWSAVILVQAYDAAHDPAWRNRIRYPMIGTMLVLVGGATNSIDALSRYPLDITANLVNALLLAYAIARYQLMDLTIVMRRLLAWTEAQNVVLAVVVWDLLL
jgi:N-terminal 7TM region of histidine kinase